MWFLTGDFRARSEAERVIAYERGMEAGRRAVAAAPQSDQAHLFLAFNTGRTAEIRGVMRALALVGSIREESDTVLKLNPSNVEGLMLAGGLAADLPAMMGGDKTKAEGFFKRALEVDPHQTGARIELARLYVANKRWLDAQRELQGVIDEPAASEHAPVDHERSAARQDAARRASRSRPDPGTTCPVAVAVGGCWPLSRRAGGEAGQGLSTWKAP